MCYSIGEQLLVFWLEIFSITLCVRRARRFGSSVLHNHIKKNNSKRTTQDVLSTSSSLSQATSHFSIYSLPHSVWISLQLLRWLFNIRTSVERIKSHSKPYPPNTFQLLTGPGYGPKRYVVMLPGYTHPPKLRQVYFRNSELRIEPACPSFSCTPGLSNPFPPRDHSCGHRSPQK